MPPRLRTLPPPGHHHHHHHYRCRRRCLARTTHTTTAAISSSSSPSSSLAARAADGSRATQIYVSRSSSPFVNLSIEHHLLKHSHPSSTVLFLYANRPCVVLGTNQNPWLEVNLPLLRARNGKSSSINSNRRGGGGAAPPAGQGTSSSLSSALPSPSSQGIIALARRRSGGGTVFHDEGNANYCVICPAAAFGRDRHAEMVARALRGLGAPTARVNARHDIVVATSPPLKVSGSAFRLTRLRALHHGTCLLSSPNLGLIGELLRSPAGPFISARGVASVRSPVANVGVAAAEWEREVVREFRRMYGPVDVCELDADGGALMGEIREGVEELMSPDWIYGRSAQFVFSTHPTGDDPRDRPRLPFTTRFQFESRHGAVTSAALDGTALDISARKPARIWQLGSWRAFLAQCGAGARQGSEDAGRIGDWLDDNMGTT